MLLLLWRLITLLLAALSMGLSLCHLMEMPVRLRWEPGLWMAATNFGGLYALFGTVGAVIDVGAIAAACGLVLLTRALGGASLRLAIAGACLMALAMAAWWSFVAPMNAIMAGWTSGAVPSDFAAVRLQWEAAHAGIAGIKLGGLTLLLLSALVASPRTAPFEAS